MYRAIAFFLAAAGMAVSSASVFAAQGAAAPATTSKQVAAAPATPAAQAAVAPTAKAAAAPAAQATTPSTVRQVQYVFPYRRSYSYRRYSYQPTPAPSYPSYNYYGGGRSMPSRAGYFNSANQKALGR